VLSSFEILLRFYKHDFSEIEPSGPGNRVLGDPGGCSPLPNLELAGAAGLSDDVRVRAKRAWARHARPQGAGNTGPDWIAVRVSVERLHLDVN